MELVNFNLDFFLIADPIIIRKGSYVSLSVTAQKSKNPIAP